MALIFPYEPNWDSGVEMDREYKTEIITARDLSEQRKAQRSQPRRKMSFEVGASGSRAEDITEYLEENAQEPFWMPDSTRSALMGEAAQIGDTEFVVKGTSGGADSAIGSRSIYYLLDRSMSLTSLQFNTIKDTALASLPAIEDAIRVGERIDLAIRFWSEGEDDVWMEKRNAQLADIAEFRDFINSTNRLLGGDVVPAYEAVLAWFQATKEVVFAARSVILVTDAASNDGFSAAASGPAADLLDRTSGEFNVDDGNAVNCFAINYNQANTTYTALLDNTAGDGIPTITDGDTEALDEAFRRAAQSWSNTPQWLRAGIKIIIGKGSDGLKELATVASVDGDSITLAEPTEYEWPANTMVRMAMLGRLEQELSARWVTFTTGNVSIVFAEDPNETYEEVYRSQKNDLWHDGREVWLRKPNWREPVDAGIQGYLTTLAFDRGVFDHRAQQPFNTRTWSATYSGLSSDAAEELIQFAHRKRGRRHSFWMPTWKADMVLAGETLAGANTLTVDGTKPFDRHDGSAHMNRVMVQFHDGTYEFNTVDSMEVLLGDTVITMRYDWSVDLTYSNVRRISWMPLWRMAADTLTMAWPTSRIGEAQIAIQQVRADHDDDGYFPITAFEGNGNHTYDIQEYGLISTGAVLGSVGLVWTAEAALTSAPETGAEITLSVAVQFYSDVLGSLGEQIGATVTHDVTATGTAELNFVDDIPARTGYVKLTYTKTATDPGGTTYGAAEETVTFRGKP